MTDIATRSITDADLAGITSYEDAARLLDSLGATPVSVEDYGNGFKVVEKDTLIGVGFVIIQAHFRDGEFGDGFVSLECVTKNNDKVVINDGSTGIFAQCQMIIAQRTEKGDPTPDMGIIVPNGLTKSAYYRNKDTGETKTIKPADGKGWEPANTFYLS